MREVVTEKKTEGGMTAMKVDLHQKYFLLKYNGVGIFKIKQKSYNDIKS